MSTGRLVRTNGVDLHVEVHGDGPPVVLCHGFPQLGIAWRHQIPALVGAGYRVIVPDLRGYGGSSVPPEVEAYDLEQLCGDLVGLLDAFGHDTAVFVGHDMGAYLVWNLAACRPERVRAVAAIAAPFTPPGRAPLPTLWSRQPGMFDYQLYFQTEGVAEAELEADPERSLLLLVRAPGDGAEALAEFGSARRRGGLLHGLPAPAPPSSLINAAELPSYADAFRRTGFRGPLNWYRNYERSWRWLLDHARLPVAPPALLVSPGRDPVLTEELTAGMERCVPRLRRERLPEGGHYCHQERPDRFNALLLSWLDDLS